MKTKLLFAAAVLAMASVSNGATYLVSNVASGTSNDVLIETKATGALLNGGIVAIGWFTGGAPSSNLALITTTISNFNMQASVLAGSYSVDLGGSYAGYYQGSLVTGSTILTGNPLIGQGVYLFAGNASTLAASTEYAIVKVGTYTAEDAAFPNQYTANASSVLTPSNRVIGTLDSVGNPLGGTSQSLKLDAVAPIPEPSAALLGALGVLGLLRRRRN